MIIEHAAIVLNVRDLEASLRFYTENLGFTENFRFGNYAGLSRGAALIHLCAHAQEKRLPGSGVAYFFCDEVDNFYAALQEKGVSIPAPPKDQEYKMRDFLLLDPDGNQLSFGSEVKQGEQQ